MSDELEVNARGVREWSQGTYPVSGVHQDTGYTAVSIIHTSLRNSGLRRLGP